MAVEQQRRIVKLSSASGEIFEVAAAMALQSRYVRNVIEDVGVADTPIPLPNVSSEVLRQVLAYCKHDLENVGRTSNLEDRFNECIVVDAKLGEVDMKNLYDLIMAADYMHIETLLHWLCRTAALVIAEKTFAEIRQIFNSGNGFARGGRGGCSSGADKTEILALFVDSLPAELQLKIKVQVGETFHHGDLSPWCYNTDAQTLIVELATLCDSDNMHHQLGIIFLHVDIGLVNTLVLQTYSMVSLSPLESGGTCVDMEAMEWIDQVEKNLFKALIDGIDMMKIENLVVDEESIY